MADTKPIVILKDGTKITLDDVSQVSQYSNRQDLDTILFFGDNEPEAKTMAMPSPPVPAALINASLTIDTDPKETKAVVEQPKRDPVVPQPPPAGDFTATISLTVGAISGAVSPALASFIKNFLKNKLKGDKQKEDEPDEPTDCKTHQIKSNAKLVKMAARISALETKPSSKSELLSSKENPLEDLEERITKLEKLVSLKGKKK